MFHAFEPLFLLALASLIATATAGLVLSAMLRRHEGLRVAWDRRRAAEIARQRNAERRRRSL